ncbi:MAG: VanZ family protein [Bifidobacteriaceae bacterium]|jgi:glycopeptide antibiotics resistance protein|nr:VanZ family protein [Bifidobacteriaceae bacterium]
MTGPHPGAAGPDAANGRKLTGVLLGIYLAMLVAVVLFKLPFYSPGLVGERVVNLIPLQGSFDASGGISWREVGYNVALFAPLGAYTSMMTHWTAARRVFLVAGVSILFEVAQYAFGLGVADVTDVLANTLGGAIGTGAHALLQRGLKPHTARIENLIASILTLWAATRFIYLAYLSHLAMQSTP